MGYFFKKFKNLNLNVLLSKTKTIFIIAIAIVVVLIFLSSFNNKEDNEENKVENNFSISEYCDDLENRLSSVLETIKGIGNVNVFIAVESSPTIKYLEEKKETVTNKDGVNSTTIETTVVLTKNGSVTSPVVLVEMTPKILGVLVVASGAKDIKLKNNLINTISVVLDVSVSKVEVLEGK